MKTPEPGRSAPETEEPRFRVVPPAAQSPAELPPPSARPIEPSVIWVDYNSRPMSQRGPLFDRLSNVSLSLTGAIALAAVVCFLTVLVCLIVLPRL